MTSTHELNTINHHRKTPALLDGVVTLVGLLVATGGYFNSEIMMWWVGA